MAGSRRADRDRIVAAAIDEAPACVFVADADMRYVAVNRYACELLGYSEDELLQMRVSDVAKYDQAADEYAEMVDSAYRSGISRIVCKDGEELSLHYVAGRYMLGGETLYVSIGYVEFESS